MNSSAEDTKKVAEIIEYLESEHGVNVTDHDVQHGKMTGTEVNIEFTL